MKNDLIKYFKELGIEVYTHTKARGHQGFFLKNRIDISKNIREEKIVPTLIHEFVHYIHAKFEPEMITNGGSLEKIFQITENDELDTVVCQKELLKVTSFVDMYSHNNKLELHKKEIKEKIKDLEKIIKQEYPNFMRSKKFKEFDKYIKKSKARYLLRYDKVKFVSPSFWGLMKKFEIFSIDKIEQDFPEMPAAFCAYIRLKSAQKKQSRISARINKLHKYYSKPTELFARFVEGLYIDEAHTQACAPHTTKRFFELLSSGYYFELQEVFELFFNPGESNLIAK